MRVIDISDRLDTSRGPAFEILCDEGRVRITFISSNILRVQATREELYRRYKSFAVDEYAKSTTVEISKQQENWSITTPNLQLLIEDDPLRLIVKDSQGETVSEDHVNGGILWDGAGFIIRKQMHSSDAFYGLGEKAYGLNKRGARYEMWATDNPEYGPASDPLYQSIPFFQVLHAGTVHGVFLDNTYRTFFDFSLESEYQFGSVGGPLDYYLIIGPTFERVLDGYTRLTGRPHFIPRWALGHQHSRWMVYENQDDLLSIAQEYRERNIPCDTIVLDIAYMHEYRVFTWDTVVFPNPHDFTGRLAKLGFRVMAIMDPGVKLEEGFSIYEDGLKQDVFLRQDDGTIYVGLVWPGETVFPDFTRPEVRQWFASKFALLRSSGLSNSIWIDMNEPSNCIYEGLRDEYSMSHVVDSDGNPWEERLRNVYALGMCEASFNGIRNSYPHKRPFILTRSGFAGYQRYAATWTGDNRSTWNHLRLSIPMLLNLGLSGIPICGADVGGFSDDVTGELLVRWYQTGSFYPFFRNHSRINTARQEPWLFGSEYEEAIRSSVNLRYQLFRYFYSLAWNASMTGIPIMRPLVMEFPDDSQTYSLDTQFMIGSFIMVAPILEAGATSREVYIPTGTWFSFWDQSLIRGHTRITVQSPIDRFPLFIRGGAIIPTGKIIQHTDEDQGDLVLWIYPQGRSDFTLFEDDGITENGPSSTIRFSVDATNNTLLLTIGAREGDWVPAPRVIVLQIFGMNDSVLAKLDGADIMPRFTTNGILFFTIPDDGLEHHLHVVST